MPHFIIEHGNAFSCDESRHQAMQIAGECGASVDFIRTEDIKIRLISCVDFLALDGRLSFIHITVRMLEGRSTVQKIKLSELLRDTFANTFPQVESISIDIVDMNANAYKKCLSATDKNSIPR